MAVNSDEYGGADSSNGNVVPAGKAGGEYLAFRAIASILSGVSGIASERWIGQVQSFRTCFHNYAQNARLSS